MPTAHHLVSRFGACRLRSLAATWKKDPERGAFTKLTLHLDPALVMFDYAVDGGQAQSRAATDGLGGKKGLKNPRQVFLGNATARVCHGQADELTSLRLRGTRRVFRANLHRFHFNTQSTSLGHGIT